MDARFLCPVVDQIFCGISSAADPGVCSGHQKSFEEIFNRVKKTKKIKEKSLIDMFVSTVHKDDFLGLNRNIEELMNNNYSLRKKEIFDFADEEELVKVSIHDI